MTASDPSVLARRALVGAVSGVVPGLALVTAIDPPIAGLVVGPALGALYGLAFDPTDGAVPDHALAAAALAIPVWVLVRVTALPLVRAGRPAWTLDAVQALLPGLAAWVVAGATLGVTVPVVAHVVEARFGPVPEEPPPEVETRIVILGGGFAGLATAQRLEELFGPDPTVELTLVSETNAILFTPMLAEVAAGSLAPTDITSPLRTSLQRTQVVQATAADVHFGARKIYFEAESAYPASHGRGWMVADGRGSNPGRADGLDPLPYDHLVLAVGSTTNYFGMEGVAEFAFDFKSLGDAMRIRNHVVSCFERANRTDDPVTREALVTFVVGGGGFAGAELAGALNDLVHEMLVYYPNIPPDEVRVVVVHAGDHVMPALSESLSTYARERMSERGVSFRLGTRVEGADPDVGTVSLSSGETLQTETFVWTAGVQPNPLVERLDVPRDAGAVRTDETLAVPERAGVWAVGDCAATTDPETGERHPNTAQYAVRAGDRLAENIHADVTGGDPAPMTYRSLGTFAVIGHQTACGEVRGHCFSGLLAWLLWRAIYLHKLPGTERKIRVSVSWLIEMFFPRDIVQTMEFGPREVSPDE